MLHHRHPVLRKQHSVMPSRRGGPQLRHVSLENVLKCLAKVSLTPFNMLPTKEEHPNMQRVECNRGAARVVLARASFDLSDSSRASSISESAMSWVEMHLSGHVLSMAVPPTQSKPGLTTCKPCASTQHTRHAQAHSTQAVCKHTAHKPCASTQHTSHVQAHSSDCTAHSTVTFAIPSSDIKAKALASVVFSKCVPPQNSTLN